MSMSESKKKWMSMTLLQNDANKQRKWPKLWHIDTYLRILSENFPINTNMTRFILFSKTFASLC